MASRIIPVVLFNNLNVVKGKQFDSWRGIGSAVDAMRLYAKRKPDELIFLDVGATRAGRHPDFDLIAEVADEFSCPLTVGGGIQSVEDVKTLMRSGADKVCIGTRIDLIPEIASTFGTQAVVASVDYRADECYIRSGELSIGFGPVAMAKRLADDGAGEILLNCIDRDGTQSGYDLGMLATVTAHVDVPVTACGGCSGYPDMAKAFRAGASAAAAGALFAFTEATPREASRYLRSNGIHVRIM